MTALEESVHSLPYTKGALGDIYIGGFRSALLAAFSFFIAVLGYCMAHLSVSYGD
jgi:hypothetical protein